MRVLVAPDSWTGTLSAGQAAAAIVDGWQVQAPHDELDPCPLSGGGAGFVEVLYDALGGRLVPLTVDDPLGRPAHATLLLATAADGVPTAYVESAQACGPHLVRDSQADRARTSTAGVGQLLLAARHGEVGGAPVRRIVCGIGGSAAADAGAGLLAAVGGEVLGRPAVDDLRSGGAGLQDLDGDDLAPLADLRARWGGIDLVAATDADIPLLGHRGVARLTDQRTGADGTGAEVLEAALTRFATAAMAGAGAPQRTVALPGAGAGGGLGFGMFVLGARRQPAVAAVADAVDLRGRLSRADLAVTGEGTLDWRSLDGSVVAEVAAAGLRAGVPVIAVAGQVELGRRELLTLGVESAYPVARTASEAAASMADPAGRLTARVRRIARTWSPPAPDGRRAGVP